MQLREHLEENSLFSKYQSYYRKLFLRKPALVKVKDDWLLNLDQTKGTF